MAAALVIAMGVYSCKKNDERSTITTFLTHPKGWALASMQVQTYHGDTLKRTDTLNTNCNLDQTFKLTTDGHCTYENYSCMTQLARGDWSMQLDSLLFRSNIVCQDTSAAKRTQPFFLANIINLGQNSMVLQTVRIDTLTKKPAVVLRKRITRFGFIH